MNPTAAEAARIQETLDHLWRAGKGHSLERVAVIEAAVASLLLGEEHFLEEAARAAHKLAGTLGIFGLPGGSTLARTIENLLSNGPLTESQGLELSELAVELRQSVESATETEPGDSPRSLRPLYLVGPDSSYFEALRIGAERRGWRAQQRSEAADLQPSGTGVVVFACSAAGPIKMDIDAARSTGLALVVATGASCDVVGRLALAEAGVDLVIGAHVEPERTFELIEDELGRRRRTARLGTVGATAATRQELARCLGDWRIFDVALEELFGSTELPEMLLVDADALGVDTQGLCRALLGAADQSRCVLFPVVADETDQSSVTALLTIGVAGVLRRSDPVVHMAERLRTQLTVHSRRSTEGIGGSQTPASSDETVNLRVRTARRTGDSLSVLFLVPRDLEQVNIREGRGAGDELLKRVQRALSASFRSVDLAGRWGAGHLVVLDTDRLAAADRLAELVSELDKSGTAVDGAVAVLGEDGNDGASLLRSMASQVRPFTDNAASDRKILLVEDDPLVACVVTDLLEYHGHGVTVISDGRTAADLLLRPKAVDQISLVVLDVSLPGLDGFAILRQLKRAGTTPRLPIVLLTARATEEEIVTGLELGAIDHVAKPFSPPVLMRRIERALGT